MLSATLLSFTLAACSSDDSQGSGTQGSSSSNSSSSTSTTSETSTSTTDATTTTTTGGACEAEEPFQVSIAQNSVTYGTCGVPFEFFAKRKAGTLSVERCTDDTCASCDPDLAYDLDFGSSTVVPDEECLRISHETKSVNDVCRSRSFVIWRVGQTAPLIVATTMTPEPPPTLTPATLATELLSARECSCSTGASWCCGDSLTIHNIRFSVEGGDSQSVSPGLANFKQIKYADSTYEAVVTQAFKNCESGDLETGWYLRRL
ncbi:MAG TPA: hypothetical protein ENJ18_07495 [Nannocystis exedens]|nr:hypothetical protein [Nannocystis exedens]